ncbi:MAG: hypothetical protein IMY71_13040 [Bacteroidetes bacterium]|nr:hypothetical protein [Bacteroidota bacterium]
MKNIKYLLLIIGIILAFQSCEDESKIRFPEFEDAANMRIQIDPDYSSIDASDISNAKLVFSVFSENTNIESVVISAVYYSFQNDSTTDPVEVLSLTQSDFNAANGAIRDREFTAQFLAEKFGLPGGISDLGGGDRFDFFNVTTLTNGMVFPDTILSETDHETVNVTPNIINSSGTTSFTVGFTAYVACPVPNGFATGDYMFEQIAGPADPWFGEATRWKSEVVTLTQVSPIERTFNGTYLIWDGRAFNFLLICGNVLVGHQGTGIGCGGPGLNFTGATPPGTYDQLDDSLILIEIIENVDGDCGVPTAEPMTLRLTKIN